MIGAIGALLACPGCALLERLQIDDPVGCVPTHGLAGIWGLVSVAFFAEKDMLENRFSNEFGILKGGPWSFLGVQLLMVVSISAWAAVTSFLELLLVNRLLGLRMSVEDELLGADKVEHGIEDYDPNPTQERIDNEGEDNLKSVELNLSPLETADNDGTLSKTDNGRKNPRKTIRARRKLLRPNWRKAVSLKNSANDNLHNGTISINGAYYNGGVSLDVVVGQEGCNVQGNGSLVTTTANTKYFQTS